MIASYALLNNIFTHNNIQWPETAQEGISPKGLKNKNFYSAGTQDRNLHHSHVIMKMVTYFIPSAHIVVGTCIWLYSDIF